MRVSVVCLACHGVLGFFLFQWNSTIINIPQSRDFSSFSGIVLMHASSPELANSVAINGSSENSLLAGGTYSFECIVESDLTPTVRWMDANRTSISNGSEFQIEKLITSGLQTILRLTFSNLNTSLGGIYYCESTIIKPQSIKEASRAIKVKSKLLILCLLIIIY